MRSSWVGNLKMSALFFYIRKLTSDLKEKVAVLRYGPLFSYLQVDLLISS